MAASNIAQRVAIIGSGNWGSAIARIVGSNAKRYPAFEDTVRMWVYEEQVDGKNLTEIINEKHENVKYLPGVKLPENVQAVPELEAAVDNATLLVFVLPHQFLPRLLPTIKDKMHKDAAAITLIKGIDFNDKGIVLVSDTIREGLGCEVSSLMGANVANEVAKDEFCEATIGSHNKQHGQVFQKLFDTPNFKVNVVEDSNGVELCGALKNIVALGAGFVDGLEYGGNTKAAIIRIGLAEMKAFCHRFFSGIKDETFLESCGIADLITTCYGGRNRKCAEAFAKTGKGWETLEQELLNGQKLQGTLACEEVYKIIKANKAEKDFPLFTTIHRVAFEGLPPKELFNGLSGEDNQEQR